MTIEERVHFDQHVRRYLYVFYALIFGTIVTVGASYIHFGSHEINIAVALAIAFGKAALVAAFFMHLISERKLIYGLLAFTGGFCCRPPGADGVVLRRLSAFDGDPLSHVAQGLSPAFHLRGHGPGGGLCGVGAEKLLC